MGLCGYLIPDMFDDNVGIELENEIIYFPVKYMSSKLKVLYHCVTIIILQEIGYYIEN